MATSTAPPKQPPAGSQPRHTADQYEAFIEQRLERTRRQIWAVDLAVSILLLLVGVMSYLLATAVIDHWLVPRGLSVWGRVVLWVGLVAGGGAFLLWRLLPLLLYRITPLFAAQTIEQHRPSFKNSLINFLFLRRDRGQFERDLLARRVFEGLESQTAVELSHIPPDTAVDRSHVIHLGYVLAGLIAICSLYLLFSPKNPLTSFRRVLWPWAEVAAPTRVEIKAVQPGDAVADQGDTLLVSAEVRGVRPGDPVTLYYSTADGQSTDQAIPMTLPEKGFRYQCELPPGKIGLQQDLDYYLVAGDGATRPYHIEAQVPLAITVESVEYDFPEYTALPPQTVEKQGDLRAIEGTYATIRALANYPIQQAAIEFDADSRRVVAMTAKDTFARGGITLRMNPDDPTQPEHSAYTLRFKDSRNRENRRPIRHRIEVIPDAAPTVRFVDPPPAEVQLPIDAHLDLKVRAEDPDFGLRRVAVRAEREGKSLPLKPLLDRPKPQKAHRGVLEQACRIEPAKLDLHVGDRIKYWAEAADNKENDKGPAPNQARTEGERWIEIVAQREPPPEQPKDGQGNAGEQKPDQGAQNPEGKPQDNPKPQDNDQQNPGAQRPKDGEHKPDRNQDPAQRPKDDRPKNQDHQEHPEQQDSPQPKSPDQQNQQKQPQGNQGGSGGDEHGQADQQGGGNQGGKSQKSPKGSSSGGEQGQPSETSDSSAEQNGEQKPGQGGQGQSSQRREPVNGKENAGDAMERILEHQREQQQKQGESKPSSPDASQQPLGADPAERKPSDQRPGGQDVGKPQEGKPDQKTGSQPQQKPGEQPEPQSAPRESSANQGSAEKNQAKRPGSQPPGARRQGDPQAGQPKSPDSGQQPEGKPDQPQKAAGQEKQPAGAGRDAAAEKPDALQPGAAKPEDSSAGKSEPGMEDRPNPKSAGEPKPPGPPQGKGEQSPAGEQKPEGAAGTGDENKKAPGEASAQPDQKSGMREDPQGKDSAGKKAPGEQPQPDAKGAGGSGEPQPKPETNPMEKGAGQSNQGKQGTPPQGPADSQTGEPAGQPKEQTGAGADAEKPKAKAGEPKQGAQANGEEKSAGKSGSPGPQESQDSPKAKPGESAEGQPKSDNDAQSPSISKPSNADSSMEGDRSGKGKRGGGQQSPQAGTDTAGNNTSADEGAGKSDERGPGEVGTKGGDQAKADRRTGQPGGKDKGEGRNQQSGGKEPGGEPKPDQPKGEGNEQPGGPSAGKPGEAPPKPGGSRSGNPVTGGAPGKQDTSAAPPPLEDKGPDDPNLEYSRKATNLALQHLEEEMGKEQSDLLDRLGWSREDAQRFLRQWENMRNAAKEPGPKSEPAKRELDAALKSLGLRPEATQLRGGRTPGDRVRDIKDAGRSPPPPQWREQFKAYTEGMSSGKR